VCELISCFLFADLEDYFKLERLFLDIKDFKTPFELVERVINTRDGL